MSAGCRAGSRRYQYATALAVPAMALLVLVAMPFNDGFYGFWINYDAQGDAQQYELLHTTRVFRYTSGVLCGQVLALLAGTALASRRTQARALAVPLAVLLAGVAVAVAYPLARARESVFFTPPAHDDPVLVRVLLCEVAAYPLYAAAGVGLGLVESGHGHVDRARTAGVPGSRGDAAMLGSRRSDSAAPAGVIPRAVRWSLG